MQPSFPVGPLTFSGSPHCCAQTDLGLVELIGGGGGSPCGSWAQGVLAVEWFLTLVVGHMVPVRLLFAPSRPGAGIK